MKPPLPASALNGFRPARSYDAHRPGYPSSAISALLTHMRLADRAGARVLELGAGTGKFTAHLAARAEGYDVLAVEPHAGMRGVLEGKVGGGMGGGRVSVREGTAGDLAFAGDAAWDGVVAAQSFHWFANATALKEIHRVLRPGGVLGLIWNVEDYNAPPSWTPTTPWEARVKALTLALADDAQPRFRHERWEAAFAPHRQRLFAAPVGAARVPTTSWLRADAVWARYATLSQVAVLGGEERATLRSEVMRALGEGGAERNERGEVAVHGVACLAWAEKI
ncbi:MAG: hypothetical protein M1832_006004 [Thelocarpon impressellum]|nr:MAG: hypothetical protein M1832_006004 [Thelocarpon impressellum]